MDASCGLCGGEPNCQFFYDRVEHCNGVVDTTDRRRNTPIKGPLCMIRANDLGFAVGSALWIASTNFVDAKPCYSVGLAGINLGYCKNSEIVIGILLAVAAKNPYADIPPEYHLTNMSNMIDSIRKIAIVTRQIPNHPYIVFDPKKTSSSKEDKEE